MRTTLLTLTALLLAGSAAIINGQQAGRDSRTGPTRGTGAIAGFVVDEGSGQPLRRVEVTLVAAELGQRRVLYTDAAGSFTFANLPPGRYSLSADKAGWIRAAYGARQFDRRGTPIQLATGQTLTNLRLGTRKGGVITGQVLDETGLPAAGVQVRALEYRTVLGERRLSPVAGLGGLFGETTDDRGMYRLYGLPAGEYAVIATPRLASNVEIIAMSDAEIRAALQAAQQPAQPGTTVGATSNTARPAERRDDGVTVGYAPVFYPGTTNAMQATSIQLAPGEERSSIDMQIQLVRTGRVEGTVVPPPGVPPQAVQVMLTPEAQVGMIGSNIGMSVLNRATPDAEGKFSFRSVVPGRYTLTARAVQGDTAPAGASANRTMVFQMAGGGAPVVMGGEGGSDRPAFWASNELTINGENVDNQVLALQPAMTMTGRVQFAGKSAAPADLTRVRLTVVPAALSGQQIMMGMPSVSVAADGTFTASNITPGRYVVSGVVPTPRESFTPVNWRLQSAVVDGRDILDFPLEVLPNMNLANVVATFSDITQGVSGVLQDAGGRPAPDYTIVVFAAESAYWQPNARRVRTARPGTDGRFSVDNLPPGAYRMAAVVDMADAEAWDPAFLEQLVPASFAFELAAGEKKVQDMRISGGGL